MDSGESGETWHLQDEKKKNDVSFGYDGDVEVDK